MSLPWEAGNWDEDRWHQYTDEQLVAGWENREGQGNRQAREGGQWVVKIPDVRQVSIALMLTRRFLRSFNIPSCSFWDGDTLHLYCGDAGSQGAFTLRSEVKALRDGYFLGVNFK